jgi:peptidyl-prolyl cis-trans isomerase C
MEKGVDVQFKRWLVALVATIALVACGSPSVQTAARLDNVILSRQELDRRVNRMEQALQKQPQQQGQMPSKLDIEQRLVDQFINQNLILSLARQHGVSVTDSETDAQIADFRSRIEQSGTVTFDEAVQAALGLTSADSTDFREFVSSVVAQQKLSQTLVTTDTVRQQVTDQIMAETKRNVLQAKVAHILVDTEEEANKVIERLGKGEKFEDLAKELSKDPGSAQNGGVYDNVQQGQMVPEFDKATFQDLKPGETTKVPVKTQFGYHIIKLIDRSEHPAMNEEQAKQAIEQAILPELQKQRQQSFQQLIEQERAKAKQEHRLEEPAYPTPAPAPAPGGQPAQPDQNGQPAQPTAAPAP